MATRDTTGGCHGTPESQRVKPPMAVTVPPELQRVRPSVAVTLPPE